MDKLAAICVLGMLALLGVIIVVQNLGNFCAA